MEGPRNEGWSNSAARAAFSTSALWKALEMRVGATAFVDKDGNDRVVEGPRNEGWSNRTIDSDIRRRTLWKALEMRVGATIRRHA